MSLNFSNNLLEEDGARSFAEFLQHTKTLKVIKAVNCGLSDKSALLMKEAIQKNPSIKLEHLDLSGNPFEKKGMEDLLSFIINLKHLENLNLSNCI